jgi:hypothetical protein
MTSSLRPVAVCLVPPSGTNGLGHRKTPYVPAVRACTDIVNTFFYAYRKPKTAVANVGRAWRVEGRYGSEIVLQNVGSQRPVIARRFCNGRLTSQHFRRSRELPHRVREAEAYFRCALAVAREQQAKSWETACGDEHGPACGGIRVNSRKPTMFSPRSTAGSPRASICWT